MWCGLKVLQVVKIFIADINQLTVLPTRVGNTVNCALILTIYPK